MLNVLMPATLRDFEESIQKALDLGGNSYTMADIEELIAAGNAQFWPGETSCIVTEIIEYPQTKDLHFFLAGGNLEELEAMLPPILDWGRANGCTRATLTGRRGWERSFLRDTGWRPRLIVMEREI